VHGDCADELEKRDVQSHCVTVLQKYWPDGRKLDAAMETARLEGNAGKARIQDERSAAPPPEPSRSRESIQARKIATFANSRAICARGFAKSWVPAVFGRGPFIAVADGR
jgi:hypothetical protein